MSEYNLPDYGTNIHEYIRDKIQTAMQKIIGEPMNNQALSVLEYNCKEIIKSLPFTVIDSEIIVKQDEFDTTKINFTFPFISEILGYILFDPKNDNHYWDYLSDTNVYLNSGHYTSFKCRKCGLEMIINNGWKLAKQNLTCEEMVIKDIIE